MICPALILTRRLAAPCHQNEQIVNAVTYGAHNMELSRARTSDFADSDVNQARTCPYNRPPTIDRYWNIVKEPTE
jgi:hypothetical protein